MQTKTIRLFRILLGLLLLLTGVIGLLFAGTTLAAINLVSLSSIAENVDTSVAELAIVLSDISLIAGVGFVMASFFKFHQHKLNPIQVSISQGVTLLLIGAGLVLFPTMFPTAKQAIFGKTAEITKVGGGQVHSIISSS
ncbi:type IV secretion protein IcmD [Coxiella endosymbiont of Ornithodoros maritimus]|uniref:type IV secretion protein IcmD n=1 Tax=Coxiella endosymbiont of Ornithodoros maritimus TaxID=1656172 RepID=UPI002264ADA0|nr:type IV secretion protein IcmD [Coxiella endosymbiont of Ornithodoros maritimus]